MNLTKSKLKQLIQEELQNVLHENESLPACEDWPDCTPEELEQLGLNAYSLFRPKKFKKLVSAIEGADRKETKKFKKALLSVAEAVETMIHEFIGRPEIYNNLNIDKIKTALKLMKSAHMRFEKSVATYDEGPYQELNTYLRQYYTNLELFIEAIEQQAEDPEHGGRDIGP